MIPVTYHITELRYNIDIMMRDHTQDHNQHLFMQRLRTQLMNDVVSRFMQRTHEQLRKDTGLK